MVLPLIEEESHCYSDSFTRFLLTLFEEFNFDKALKECEEMKKDSESDLILKKFSKEIFEKA